MTHPTASRPALARAFVALAFALTGCGDNTVSPPGGDAATAVDAPAVMDTPEALDAGTVAADAPTVATDVPPAMAEDVPEAPVVFGGCEGVAAGMVNGFTVDGVARSFILTLPAGATGAGGRWPVVFNWHGLGDNPANMNQLLAGQVDNPTMPFVLVTPASTGLGPTTNPLGLEWEQLRARNPNREARLFDAVLGCLDRRWGVDRDRVYTVGFSAGAILSDLLGVLRGDQIAAVATYSGGYFSNPANPATLGALRNFVGWPALPSTARYPQLLLHGGARDTFNLSIATARFDQFAANDLGYLQAAGHDVVLCAHNGGHTVPTGVLGARLVEFFAAHPRTTARSPWRAALPAGWPSYCTPQPAPGG